MKVDTLTKKRTGTLLPTTIRCVHRVMMNITFRKSYYNHSSLLCQLTWCTVFIYPDMEENYEKIF